MKLKTIIMLLLLSVIASVLFSCGSGDIPKEQYEIESFIYEENTDGTLTIVGWAGLENELVIPSEINGKTVTVIGENAFRAVSGLTYVKIPDTVKVIDYAFSECESLKKVELGVGIEKMNGAFRGCVSLEEITGVPEVVEMSEAFQGCLKITEGFIPDTVRFCDSAYKGCTALESVRIEEGVTSLSYVFEGCTLLSSVDIPESVTEAVGTFDGCTKLEEVSGGENIEILESTFRNCLSLKELTLSGKIRALKGAFVNCASLEVINGLPESVSEYAQSFSGCASLTEIIIPKVDSDDDTPKYDLISDIAGCDSVEKLKVLIPFGTKNDFCKVFSGLSNLSELTIPDENFAAMMKVEYYYVDQAYEGDDSAVKNALNYALTTTYVRITDDYGYIDGVSYTHVQATDVNIFDPDEVKRESEVLGFTDFTKTTYWCGYPKDTNRKSTAIAIERVYFYHLRVTGKNDGSLPPEITVNGVRCTTETMMS